MSFASLVAKTISVSFEEKDGAWAMRFMRRNADGERVVGEADLSRDFYGWIRADGFASIGSTITSVTEDGDTVRVTVETRDKNECIWDIKSLWRIETVEGTEVLIEHRTAIFSEARYPKTGTMKSRDCIFATRIPTSIATSKNEFLLVPGAFYGDNTTANTQRCLAIYDPTRKDFDFESGRSSRWMIATDRTPMPVVFAMSPEGGLATGFLPGSFKRTPERDGDAETFADGAVGFDGAGATLDLFVTMPYFELPATFAFLNFAPPRCKSFTAFPGDVFEATYVYAPLPPGRHAYARVLEALHALCDDDFERRPWMDIAEANTLQAETIYKYHYIPDKRVIRTHVHLSGEPVSDEMMVGWCAGMSTVASIMLPGLDSGNATYLNAAQGVLDRLAAEGTSEAGALYDYFDGEKYIPLSGPYGINTRIMSEALWIWMHLTEECEKRTLIETGAWRVAIRRALSVMRDDQAETGELGFTIDPKTGKFIGRETCSSFMAIGPLARGAKLFDDPSLLNAAVRAGDFYARYLEDEVLYGATLDTGVAINSEDGYNALIAYMELYEGTGDEKWLELAQRACDWFLTFRWGYNQAYPAGTILDRLAVASKGLDTANVPNQHLHVYGALCLTEQVKLWYYTGRLGYLKRAGDLVNACLQMIPHKDGEILNMRRGMHVEQYYNCHWASQGLGKGDIDPRHVAWVPALCVFGTWRLKETFGGIVVSARHGHAEALDACKVTGVSFDDGKVKLSLAGLTERQLDTTVCLCNINGRKLDKVCTSNAWGDALLPVKINGAREKTFSWELECKVR